MRLFITVSILFVISCSLFYLLQHFPLLYFEEAKEFATKYGFDPYLIVAMIKIESDFDPKAVSPAHAYGLMQLMPSTVKWLNKRFGKNFDIEDPRSNIEAGVFYLKYLLKKFGNLEEAIKAYNIGPYAHSFGERKEAADKYIKRLFKALFIYKLLYDPFSIPALFKQI